MLDINAGAVTGHYGDYSLEGSRHGKNVLMACSSGVIHRCASLLPETIRNNNILKI